MGLLVTFGTLFLFWILLSGHFDLFHLSLGVISSAIVAHISHDLLFKDIRAPKRHIEGIRFIKYFPWLFCQIILANIHVAYLALHPRMSTRIDPHIIKFKTKLKKDLSLTTFGNSITLTPGTITVLIKEGYYYVHALDRTVAEGLPGDMEKRVGHIYMED